MCQIVIFQDPCCSQILMEYIEYLRKRSLFRLIPFFASFLSTELAAKCLKDTMNGWKRLFAIYLFADRIPRLNHKNVHGKINFVEI